MRGNSSMQGQHITLPSSVESSQGTEDDAEDRARLSKLDTVQEKLQQLGEKQNKQAEADDGLLAPSSSSSPRRIGGSQGGAYEEKVMSSVVPQSIREFRESSSGTNMLRNPSQNSGPRVTSSNTLTVARASGSEEREPFNSTSSSPSVSPPNSPSLTASAAVRARLSLNAGPLGSYISSTSKSTRGSESVLRSGNFSSDPTASTGSMPLDTKGSTRLDHARASFRMAQEFAQAQSAPGVALVEPMSPKKPKVFGRYAAAFHERRRKMAPYCRQINKNKIFQTVMFVGLLSALFLPDIWILLDRPNNKDLDVILTIVLAMFLFELAVQSIGLSRTYWGSFFFWMDLLGAGSLLLDLSYIGLLSGGDNGSVSNNVVIMRAARIAKLGARAGRFTRLVKLLRFLPGMREQGTDQGTAKVISSRLITALSTRVSCLIIIMVMVMPMFGMWTYPEQDWSMKSWLDILEKTLVRHPDRFAAQLTQFGKFYQDMDYYPFEVRAKNDPESLPTLVQDDLPWTGLRPKPNRATNFVRHESTSLECDFSFKRPNQVDSLMNVMLLLVVMILMVGFSLVLSNSVSAIVLRPLEKLLAQVRNMASTIFQSVKTMSVTMREEGEESTEEIDEDDEEEDTGNAFGNETQLLEKVVQKLAVLSEITMNKSVVDAETMEGLGEGDRAVIHGFQGSSGPAADQSRWAASMDDEAEDANYESMLSAQKAMVENAGLSLELLNSWNLNPLELDKARNHAAAMYFMGPHNHGISFDAVVMASFLEAAEVGYVKACPYHNWFHAIDVTHCVYRLLHICATEAYLNGSERYALLVSATCHDVGHPGLNNTFLIETSHELALRYNDKSPLENMHCARLFEFASVPKCNIFAGMSKQQFQEVRKICIEAILHTDNAQHFAMIKEVQMIYEVNSEILDASREFFVEDPDEFPTKEAVECFRQPESRKLLVKLFLHFADISNSTKPFRICRIWAWQVLEEFFLQGDAEKRLSVPVQALNDREKVNRAFSQVGFIEFLVSPLLFVVIKVLPPTEPNAEQMLSNVKTWHQHWLSETKPPPSEAEKKALSERIVKLENRYHELNPG